MAGDSGSVPAMRKIAVILEKGDGIEVDKKEAAQYYKIAADQGHVDSN